jgi:hypothetical protein
MYLIMKSKMSLLLIIAMFVCTSNANSNKGISFESRDLKMLIDIVNIPSNGMGIKLSSLVDKQTQTSLSTRETAPIFTLEVKNVSTKKIKFIYANEGWEKVIIEKINDESLLSKLFLLDEDKIPSSDQVAYRLVWQAPIQLSNVDNPSEIVSANKLTIRVIVAADRNANSLRWYWEGESGSEDFSLWRVAFPQITVPNIGPEMSVIYPNASGVVKKNPIETSFHWAGEYPHGGCAMQWFATYDESKKSGLYFGSQDPFGSMKSMRLTGNNLKNSLDMVFIHPLPNMGVPNNSVSIDGCVVWEALHGDWYDASIIYRTWVRKEAKWYPKLGTEGREDSPLWIRELCAWAIVGTSNGKFSENIPTIFKFQEVLGVPIGIHWYGWQEALFDHDYPHFFPAYDGFVDAVNEVQKDGRCFVTPYTNGRLWDTRDKDLKDSLFTKIGLAGVTKKENQKPWTDTYGSKETDGSLVVFGIMCPATKIWQDKIREFNLRIMNELNVAGVYDDQATAEGPPLCFDKSHGHPVGGGHWWNDGYRVMFERIRADMKSVNTTDYGQQEFITKNGADILNDRALTSECNSEILIDQFDAYLEWYWGFPGQVPSFAVVYGGAIQFFGRSYRGNLNANKMMAGEEFVFGEQLGWVSPDWIIQFIADTSTSTFGKLFMESVKVRYHLRHYFYKGEMARPLKLTGSNPEDKMPQISEEWGWVRGQTSTCDAVRTGVWRIVDRKSNEISSAIFLFANTTDSEMRFRLNVNMSELGLAGKQISAKRYTAEGPDGNPIDIKSLNELVTFPPNTAWAIEILAK